jgi:hypothetical protein
MGWLASARVAWAQEGAPPAKAGEPDAANPVVEGPQQNPPSTPPAPPGPTPEEQALRAEQAEIRAALDAVGAELNTEREQRAEEVIALQEKLEKATAALQKVTDKPPVSTAHGGVGLTGFVQIDWGAWRQSSEDQVNPTTLVPLNEERFFVRRARLRTTIERTYTAGALEFDGNTVNGSTARIVGAEASLKLPGEEGAPVPLLLASIGLFKIPFGFELLQSDRDRLFLERSTAERALFPGEYDLGARLQGGWRFARYALAVQNGNPLGERAFPGRDPNAAKDVSFHGGVDTAITDQVSVAANVSFLWGKGFHRGTAATKPTLQWSDRNENGAFDTGELVTSPGLAATPSANFDRFGLGADLRISVAVPELGTSTAYGEVYWAKNLDRAILPADPLGSIGRDYREFGAYVALMQDIGPHGTVGVRYDFYNPDKDSTDPTKPLVPADFSYGTLAAVAALRGPSERLIIEYDHNSNHLGRDTAGQPTTLKDDAVVLRGEVSF